MKEQRIILKTRDKRNTGSPNDIDLLMYSSGDIAFSQDHGEAFIYFYRDQIAHLLEILTDRSVRMKEPKT